MRTIILLLPAVLAGSLLGVPDAEAQIFKYKDKDGSVVYTDNLSDLPNERRAYYNRRLEAQESKRRQQEEALGKEEFERRQAEKEREELMKSRIEEAERQRRVFEIEARIRDYKMKQSVRDRDKKVWQTKMRQAKELLATLLKDFRKKKTDYNNLATKADFTLLPGQGTKKLDLQRQLKELEGKIDKQIELIEETIPEDARKAGIPPGWLR